MADAAYQELRQLVLKQLWHLLQGDETPHQAVEQLLKHDLSNTLAIIFSMIFDVFKLSLNLTSAALDNQDSLKQLHKMCDKVNLRVLTDWLPYCLQTRHRLHNMPGVNILLTLEALLIRWQQLRIDGC